MQGRPVRDAKHRPVLNLPVSYPEHFSGTSAVGRGMRTVSLVLNSLTLNGVPHAASDVYLGGVKRIVEWCRAHDVNIRLRCKPGYSIFRILSAYVGVDLEPLVRNTLQTMEEYVRDCDLCLLYDMPTTGALYFLRNGIAILNPLVTEQSPAFLANVHPEVIAPESLEATLRRLEVFRLDPLSLHAFRAAQFRAYLGLFQHARPLRSSLSAAA
jgi:hypothetical protein